MKVRRRGQAIVNARAAANHGVGIECVSKTQPRGNIVPVHSTVAMSRRGKDRGTGKIASAIDQEDTGIIGVWGSGGVYNGVYSGDGHSNAAIAGKIAELNQIVALRIWSAPFVAQTQVEGQLRADFPVVLKEEGRLFVLIFHRCEGSQEAVARIAGSQQNIGEGISLRVISTVDCLLGHRRREIEIARGWVGLPEIIEEDSLFAAKFPDVPAPHPGKRGAVDKKRMAKISVGATLRK